MSCNLCHFREPKTRQDHNGKQGSDKSSCRIYDVALRQRLETTPATKLNTRLFSTLKQEDEEGDDKRREFEGWISAKSFRFLSPTLVASKMFSVTKELFMQNVKLYAMLKQVIHEYFETSVAKQKNHFKECGGKLFRLAYLITIDFVRARERDAVAGRG